MENTESVAAHAGLRRIILIGGPGSGKGTQSDIICRELGIPHISTGDIIREIVESGSEDGKRFQALISTGNFIPDDDVVRIVEGRLAQADAATGYLLDGFPRSLSQAKLFANTSAGALLDRAIALEIPEDVLVERLSGRLTCLNCGATYHIVNRPPHKPGICDNCGHELVRRSDDEPDAIRQRLKVYHQKTEPLICYYRDQNKLSEVLGSGAPEEVYSRIKPLLGIA